MNNVDLISSAYMATISRKCIKQLKDGSTERSKMTLAYNRHTDLKEAAKLIRRLLAL